MVKMAINSAIEASNRVTWLTTVIKFLISSISSKDSHFSVRKFNAKTINRISITSENSSDKLISSKLDLALLTIILMIGLLPAI